MPSPGKLKPVDLIAARAADHEASVLAQNGDELLVVVRLLRSDGRRTSYSLTVDARSPTVRVREHAPQRLPAFCPDRHINRDGGFCMNWARADPLDVTDDTAADRWWGLLLQFLRLQERAAKLHRWPSHRQWAHGDAARHQQRAEICATALGAPFVTALEARRLHVTRTGRRPRFMRLQDGARTLYSVWVNLPRVATLRQGCPCGSGRVLRNCGDHARRAVELVEAWQAWRREEARFWEELQHMECCGTLASCPLKASAANLNSDSASAALAAKAA